MGAGRETGLGRRWGWVGDGVGWEMGLGGRWGWMGDGVGWEMGLGGRWGWVGDGVGWEMGLGGRWGWMGDGVGWEMGLSGRWGWMGDGVGLHCCEYCCPTYVCARVPVWVVWGGGGEMGVYIRTCVHVYVGMYVCDVCVGMLPCVGVGDGCV